MFLPSLNDIVIERCNSPERFSPTRSLVSDPHSKLVEYMNEVKTLSHANGLTASWFEDMSKFLNYPVLVLSATSILCSGLRIEPYIVMGLSIITFMCSGLYHTLQPNIRQTSYVISEVEFSEISSNIQKFIGLKDRNITDIKEFSNNIFTYIQKCKREAPPVPRRFIDQAQMFRKNRIRKQKTPRPIFSIPELNHV
jgi:hypothetical protein